MTTDTECPGCGLRASPAELPRDGSRRAAPACRAVPTGVGGLARRACAG